MLPKGYGDLVVMLVEIKDGVCMSCCVTKCTCPKGEDYDIQRSSEDRLALRVPVSFELRTPVT